MKKLIPALICFSLVGCASLEEPTSSNAQPPTSTISVQKTPAPAEKKLTGRIYYLDESKAERAVSTETIGRIRKIVRRELKALGFEESQTRRKSHLTVYLTSDRVVSIPPEIQQMLKEQTGKDLSGEVTYSRQTRVENGKTVYDRVSSGEKEARFSLTFHINAYGKRPILLSTVTFVSPKQEWTGYEDQLVASVEKEFVGMIGRAPSTDLKMKGDPGCLPRFGYEHDNYKVIDVLKGSAAQDAGMRVGDVILSIDSVAPDKEMENFEMYEKRIKVPLKLQRGDKIIRTEIQAKLMCD